MTTKTSQAIERLHFQEEQINKLKRYEFLIELLRERGVFHQYDNGVWVLKGIYGVDDSGPRGIGASIEAALDDAIKSRNEISKKWLGDPSDEQKRIEQNQSTALYIDSLIAGSNG